MQRQIAVAARVDAVVRHAGRAEELDIEAVPLDQEPDRGEDVFLLCVQMLACRLLRLV